MDTDAAGSFDIDLYITANANYVAAPAANYTSLTINSEDVYVDATGYFMPFYLELEVSSASAYAHINFGCDANVEVYLDDLRLYEVSERVSLEAPNRMSVSYQRIVDAEYEMFNKANKTYLKGWRPIYNVGYDYISAAGLVDSIGLSERMFNFFVPHSDNLAGSYVRLSEDFDFSPFKGKFEGHEGSLKLDSVFICKYKPREYGEDYFTVATG